MVESNGGQREGSAFSMLYLLLATTCSASIALIFKYSESNSLNRWAITSINYLTAVLIGGYMVLQKGLRLELSSMARLPEELKIAVTHQARMSASASGMLALLLGTATGVCYLLGFVFYQRCVKAYGAGISGTFQKLGIIIPLGLSIVLWEEIPTPLQWVGIVLAIAGIVLVNFSSDGGRKLVLRPLLLALFLTGGMGGLANKTFQMYAQVEYKELFLFAIFLTALAISLVYTLKKRKSVCFRDALVGVAVGVPNLFGSSFLILALNAVPASIAYPIYSAGSIVIINAVSMLLFREKLARNELITIGLTVVSLVFINI